MDNNAVKVLYLIMSGSKVGGAEVQYQLLIEGLRDSRYSSIVVCPNYGDLAEGFISSGVPACIMKLPKSRKAGSILTRHIATAKLMRFAREMGVALVHADFWMNHYLISVSRKLGIPCVSHVRSPLRPDQIAKYRFKDVSMIISISRRYKEMLVRAGIPSEKIAFIHDSVDLNRFKAEPPMTNVLRRDFSPEKEVLVGLVGRIEPFKKQLDFLKAVEMVLKERENVCFFLIGGVQSKKYFEKVKRFIADMRPLDRHVIFTGARDDMPEVMASLDILVTLSGGSVMLEAMACGKPVISMHSLYEMVPPLDSQFTQNNNTGMIILNDDIPALASALIRLIDDPDLRRHLGWSGRRWAEEKLSHSQMILKTRAVYDGLILH